MTGKLQGKLVAVIRIRGRVNVRTEIAETLNRLNLKRVNNCILLKVTDSYLGMLKKCESYIAYGEIADDTLEALLSKHMGNIAEAQSTKAGNITQQLKDELPFRLHPPKHGLASIKRHFNQGGTLGYMGSEINPLIKRMV